MSDLDCGQALTELYDFLHGELDDPRRADIRAHLDRCGHCDGVFVFEAELRTVIRSRVHERVPEDLRRRIAAALRDLRV